jgi:SAM-dependent methyltransferase
VIGVDISAPMLERAHDRLESGLVRGDACRLPFRDGSLQQAVAVWVAHALREPAFMFAEVARVLVGGGTYLVCPAGRPGPGDRIGAVIDEMALGVDAHIGRAARAGWEATPERILQWGVGAGFVGHAEDMEIRTWTSSPEAEIGMIHRRIWPALVDLDEVTFDRLTGPTIAVLAAMPPGVTTRSSLAEVVVLRRAG